MGEVWRQRESQSRRAPGRGPRMGARAARPLRRWRRGSPICARYVSLPAAGFVALGWVGLFGWVLHRFECASSVFPAGGVFYLRSMGLLTKAQCIIYGFCRFCSFEFIWYRSACFSVQYLGEKVNFLASCSGFVISSKDSVSWK